MHSSVLHQTMLNKLLQCARAHAACMWIRCNYATVPAPHRWACALIGAKQGNTRWPCSVTAGGCRMCMLLCVHLSALRLAASMECGRPGTWLCGCWSCVCGTGRSRQA